MTIRELVFIKKEVLLKGEGLMQASTVSIIP
jgi:hypothetical protein